MTARSVESGLHGRTIWTSIERNMFLQTICTVMNVDKHLAAYSPSTGIKNEFTKSVEDRKDLLLIWMTMMKLI